MEADVAHTAGEPAPRRFEEPAPGAGQAGWRRVVRWVADYEWLVISPAVIGLLLMGRIPLPAIAVTLILLPIPWLARRIAYGYASLRTPLDASILFFLLMNVQGIYPSTDLRLSWSVLIQDVIQIALFYAVVNGVTDRHRAGLVAGGLVFSGVIVAIGGLWNTSWPVQKLFALPQVYAALDRLHAPLLDNLTFNRNFVGSALAMLAPLSVAILASRLDNRWRVLAGTSLLIMLPILVLTQSRGALIGLAVAVLFVAAYRSRIFRWMVPLVAIVLVLAVYRAGPAQVADMVLVSDATTSAQSRFEVWSRALYMIQDFPYTGIGLGTYGVVAPVLYPFFLIGPDAVVAHPHNIYLGAAVDFGLPGLVAFIGLTTTWLLVAIMGLRRARGTNLEPIFLGLLACFIVYLVHGVFDQVTFSTKTGAALWTLMGLATAVWLRLPDLTADVTTPAEKR